MRLASLALGVALIVGILSAPLLSDAQRPVKVHRIGFLGAASPSGYASQLAGLRQGLRDLGYVEGKNIVIEYRWAEGKYERLPELAAELVRLKPDLIITHGTPGTLAAKQATGTIPIVMAISGDAVATGLVASVARPGGNITGSNFFFPELNAKRLELLKEAVPKLSRVAVLLNPGNPATGSALDAMEAIARSLKVDLEKFGVRVPEEIDGAFSAMAAKRVGGLAVVDDGMLIAHAKRVADLAAAKRLPGIGFAEYADGGGMMAYAVNFPEIWRRAAFFVDRIFKGAKPGDLPIEQATKFELVIHLKTAKTLGLAIPQSILLRADRVIE